MKAHLFTDPHPVLFLLEEVIEDFSASLEKYSERPSANKAYIAKQQERLEKLYTIYNCLEEIKYLPVWQDLEAIMHRTEQHCSNIGGHAILIRTKTKGEDHSIIDKYW